MGAGGRKAGRTLLFIALHDPDIPCILRNQQHLQCLLRFDGGEGGFPFRQREAVGDDFARGQLPGRDQVDGAIPAAYSWWTD